MELRGAGTGRGQRVSGNGRQQQQRAATNNFNSTISGSGLCLVSSLGGGGGGGAAEFRRAHSMLRVGTAPTQQEVERASSHSKMGPPLGGTLARNVGQRLNGGRGGGFGTESKLRYASIAHRHSTRALRSQGAAPSVARAGSASGGVGLGGGGARPGVLPRASTGSDVWRQQLRLQAASAAAESTAQQVNALLHQRNLRQGPAHAAGAAAGALAPAPAPAPASASAATPPPAQGGPPHSTSKPPRHTPRVHESYEEDLQALVNDQHIDAARGGAGAGRSPASGPIRGGHRGEIGDAWSPQPEQEESEQSSTRFRRVQSAPSVRPPSRGKAPPEALFLSGLSQKPADEFSQLRALLVSSSGAPLPMPPGLEKAAPVVAASTSPPSSPAFSANDSGPLSFNNSGPPSLNNTGPLSLNDSGPLSLNDSGPLSLNDSGPLSLNDSGPLSLNDSGPLSRNDSGPLSLNDSGPLSLQYASSVDARRGLASTSDTASTRSPSSTLSALDFQALADDGGDGAERSEDDVASSIQRGLSGLGSGDSGDAAGDAAIRAEGADSESGGASSSSCSESGLYRPPSRQKPPPEAVFLELPPDLSDTSTQEFARDNAVLSQVPRPPAQPHPGRDEPLARRVGGAAPLQRPGSAGVKHSWQGSSRRPPPRPPRTGPDELQIAAGNAHEKWESAPFPLTLNRPATAKIAYRKEENMANFRDGFYSLFAQIDDGAEAARVSMRNRPQTAGAGMGAKNGRA